MNSRLHALTQSAMFAALLCILSPLAIPVGPIPVTMGTFAVLLTGVVLPWRRACAAVMVYTLIGLLGLPVFSGGGSGFGVLIGPTGGYLWCYLPMTALVSASGRRGGWASAGLASLTAMLICYAAGTLQFVGLTGCGFVEALALCIWPFIPFDAAKIICAAMLGTRIRRRLQAMELLD